MKVRNEEKKVGSESNELISNEFNFTIMKSLEMSLLFLQFFGK
jgi:hypothetical protein